MTIKITFLLKKFYAPLGSFIMSAGWGWYHFSKHPKQIFIIKELILWALVYAGYRAGKQFYIWLVRCLGRHPFWYNEMVKYLDEWFFCGSLLFGIFFFQNEIFSLIYVFLIYYFLFLRSNHYLRHHPDGAIWQAVNRAVFILGGFLFIINAMLQYAAYHYYILDSNIRFFNIVLFRSIAMTLLWLLGFTGASAWWFKFRGVTRYAGVVAWGALYLFFLTVWTINVGILYYSGLYLSPVALEHAAGSAGVVGASIVWYLIAAALSVTVAFFFITRLVCRAHTKNNASAWRWYQCVIGLAALGAIISLSSFQNTPEHAIIKSFYDYYAGADASVTLDPAILAKLQKFGLSYQPDQFYVNSRPQVYATSTKHFLPARLAATPPNIVIIFLESFSARLSDVYSNKFPGVTPNLLAFSKDPHTTVFKNYYNASTPTITGTLSQLCSFLPPTGHNEIENERKLQSHRLLCLPEVLKKTLGFKYANYITAVDKEFAHKNGIFTSMGVDDIFGTAELAQRIPGVPLSWGYSDHQMFPELFKEMSAAKTLGQEPFLMMLATVDTHPPFNLAKDAVNYGDGSQAVLNSFHTTDDAFGKFWEEFKNSPAYNDTILITVADHAIFPSALTKDLFPAEAKQLTYYDPNLFMMYVPDGLLPPVVDTLASGLDVTPTLLQILGVNIPNSFEGHSIFDDRAVFPNILGMHELGLYINQKISNGKHKIDYNVPSEIVCPKNYLPNSTPDLTECDYLQFYNWKRAMFEEGRFWKH